MCVGFEYEEIIHKDTRFTVWDCGGDDKIRSLWAHHYEGLDLVGVFIVLSVDLF